MGEKIEDMGEGMQCSDHPYRNNPGGICAFCLQEKLGKLVSSSKSNSFYPVPAPSSSSSSPSRSDYVSATAVGGVAVVNNNNIHVGGRTQIPFFAHKKKKVISSDAGALVLKRSRSVAVPRHHCTDDSPRLRKGFWSFLRRRAAKPQQQHHQQPGSPGGRKDDAGGSTGDENESPNSSSHASSSFGRKVARSRSVGCGSRSFSGDFLERISTGLGDCALRRVESQREAKPKIVLHRVSAAADDRIKEKVKCGGIFGMMGGSSSSSYWLSDDLNGRISQGGGATPHGRSKSWGWAFASPMRAFRPSSTKSSSSSYISASSSDNINNNKANGTTTSDGRRPGDQNHHKIDASPSLLAVRT
ncbi:hypothetical protein MRB53_006077 [Persea americana]|uniref:Uncharacterized protein n=1 Tax=Persea americana TaxID=3435 RepID=A0ACC2MFC9_PERAE|nr:hypothetical protein MRB53_006077 [Persea americana]|eukprot:TRINITY_DN85266_c0_g1_i1.p1 TRINITY_DN85266_c0_g1~~TRINITY_DN85266_c0_g1_i1.p1  ORF type:complete len:358 (-),score=74.10 TRINITY_DN85266_c0_g1_i1:231-1304(-)